RRADVMRPGSGGCFSSRVRLFVAMALASALIARARILLTSDFGLQTSATPRVVVLIVVDQMRADYFERYANQFTDGFKRLWDRGAVFTEARYPYSSNKTAQAHALMLSGWSPYASGIVGDRWWDRHTGALVTAGASADHKLLETGGDGGSPEQLL